MSVLLKHWSRLYSNMTPAEVALEPEIAKLGVRYRVQHPVWKIGVFPDFVLLDYSLVLEVDDPSHDGAKKKEADRIRTEKLNRLGWSVVRTTNKKALANPARALSDMLREAKLDHLIKEN